MTWSALRLAGPFRLTVLRLVAEDDHVVAQVRGRDITRAGVSYENTYCWVCRMNDGRVRELTEYSDTELVTAALGPRTLGTDHHAGRDDV